MPLILSGNVASATAAAYEVANSCRFNDDDTAFLSKTFSGDGTHHDKGTVSFWVKRGELTDEQGIFTAGSSDRHLIRFETSGNLSFRANADSFHLITTQLFRDPSAWYHIVIAYDTSQGTEGNRVKFYVNGTQVTSFGTETYPSQNLDIKLGAAELNCIGKDSEQTTPYLDGYLSEFVYIDGTQLDASSFGEFDSASPTIWKPKDVSGLTFGTNGFYLDFEDSADLGADVSGNSNDFTVTNLDATDQATDTPTNNFCTFNSVLNANVGKNLTLSQGNCKAANAGDSQWSAAVGTVALNSGKWYWEAKTVDVTNAHNHGVLSFDRNNSWVNTDNIMNQDGYSGYYNADGGETRIDNIVSTSDFGTFADNDILGFYLNCDDDEFTIYKNGGSHVSATSLGNGKIDVAPVICHYDSGDSEYNFGGCSAFTISSAVADADGYGSFEYSPTIGGVDYFAICTKNLAEYG